MFGWLADYSFPFGQAIDLVFACFKGTVASRINNLQQKLQKTDIHSQSDRKKQVQTLTKLESQAWLYEGVLERLGADPSVNHEKVARTLEALEYKRTTILQDLEPRRSVKYRIFSSLQDSTRAVLASQAEKDYEQLQKITTNLVLFARNQQPSQIILSEIVDKLAKEITKKSGQISPYRLRLAYRLDELMNILESKLILNPKDLRTSSSYHSKNRELRSRLNTLSRKFDSLLVAKQREKKELDIRLQQISSLSRKISELHREISNRDTDIDTLQTNIQDLTKTVQDKQNQITNFEGLVSNLKDAAEKNTEFDQNQKSYIDEIQAKLLRLSQQNSVLERKIKDFSMSVQKKDNEVEELRNEKSQLSIQKNELDRQYQILYQNYQKQKAEIDTLRQENHQINLSKDSQASKSETIKKEISVEEYQRISNKSDYTYVKAHYRKGRPVKAHYRRLPKKY
ncbi:MAG: hypothetical protein AAF821_24915 [Cyanobacteria bacterium P01_D01_bin.156]